MFLYKYACFTPETSEVTTISELKGLKYRHSTIDTGAFEKEFLPNKSDTRVMRRDVIACCVLIQRLLTGMGNRENMSLLVANGAFVDGDDAHYLKLRRISLAMNPEMSLGEKLNAIYRSCPPLLALETLSNSTMSYLAQYSGIKGNCATFGNTSLAAAQVMQYACHQSGDPMICAVASNIGGDYSYLSNSGLLPPSENHFEGTGALVFLLGNTQNANAIAKIEHVFFDERIPSLENSRSNSEWETVLRHIEPGKIWHSGAFTREQWERDALAISRLGYEPASHFECFGNMGPASVFLDIVEAADCASSGETFSIVNRDIFNRFSAISLRKV